MLGMIIIRERQQMDLYGKKIVSSIHVHVYYVAARGIIMLPIVVARSATAMLQILDMAIMGSE